MMSSQTRLARCSTPTASTRTPTAVPGPTVGTFGPRFSKCRGRFEVRTATPITEEAPSSSYGFLSTEERTAMAQKFGYRSIGKELPDDVTLSDIVKTMPKEVFEIDDLKAWRAVAITVASVSASMWCIAAAPWYLLPFAWLFAGTAATGLFVIGHDCGHRSFSKNKLVEDIVGTLVFAPLIYPFEPWRIKHNHHHAHTNKLQEDTAWHPVMKTEMAKWPKVLKGLFWLFYGSPLKCWASIGHWAIWHFNSDLYTPKQMGRVWWSWAACAAFVGIGMPLIVANLGWAGLAKFWLFPWLGYHFWMSTFTVVHHTAPHIPFNKADDWNAAKAQLSGSVHCDYPGWIDFLTHDISWHVPHHINAKIPWYNLRAATRSLRENWGEHMTECTFNWRIMKSIFTDLHVYDDEKNYVPLDYKKESPFLSIQRKVLPESASF